MPATLRVTREMRGALIELRKGLFDIRVDGTTVGTIKLHDTVELPIEPGHHTIQLRDGRYSSRSLPFDVPDEQVVNFLCHGPSIWPIYVAALFMPNLGITLKPQ
jgi:hypothetical protein